MKIAQVTPLYEAVRPKLYGGTERVVAHLTDALVDLGHDVTLFASADARTKARLVPIRDQAIRLFPIDWPEPFGLVMIEAMACGTPVVAYRRGAAPEVIEDGETGFLVDTQEQAIAATGRAHRLDRHAIRARFMDRFSAEAMARRYLDVYGALRLRRPSAGVPPQPQGIMTGR